VWFAVCGVYGVREGLRTGDVYLYVAFLFI
jgi:hypothetical protein